MNIDNVEKIYQVIVKFRKLKLGKPSNRALPHAELMMLWRISYGGSEDGVTVSLLGELLEISKPAVSQKLKILEKRGLVLRHTPEGDRRKVLIKLSDEGEKLLEEESERMMKKLVVLFEDVDDEDAACFFKVLSKMYDSVDKRIKENARALKSGERGNE